MLAWYLLSAKQAAAATPGETWLYTPTAEASGVTTGTGKSSLSGIATALGLAPAALGAIEDVVGLAEKAGGLVSGLFGGGAAATGVAAFAPGAVPASYIAADVPFSGTLELGEQAGGFFKDIIGNVLFGAGIPTTTTGIGGFAGSMGAAEFAAMEGFQAAEAGAGVTTGAVAGASSPWYAWAGPVSAMVAPLIPIIQTITSGYAAEEKAAHEATAANTGALAQAPYLINWIAAHPFDSSFEMYWLAMNELPEQYAAQKAQFNAARAGTPVPESVSKVAGYVPSAEDVQTTIATAVAQAAVEAGTLTKATAVTPSEIRVTEEYFSAPAVAERYYASTSTAGEPGSAGG